MKSQESESENSIITGWEEKPHLQKAILHNGRVEKGPVEHRDKKGYGGHHILRKGCTSQKSENKGGKSYLKTPGEFIQEGKGAAIRNWTPGLN